MIKKLFILLCLCCIGIGSAWGEPSSVELCTGWGKELAYATEYTNKYDIDDLQGGTAIMTLGVKGVYRAGNVNTYFQMNKKTGYFKNTTKLPGKITKIETTWSAAKGPTKCYFATNSEASSSNTTVTVTAATSVTYTPPTDADYYFFNLDVSTGSGSAQMTSCIVYYEKAGPAKTLTSISVSGAPTKTSYFVGDTFDPAGLTVTGTYDDQSTAEITSGITWDVTPSGALTVGTTSVKVKAKVGEITSPEYTVNGLTVKAALPKITITADKIADFASSYAEYTWTDNGVSGNCWAYRGGSEGSYNIQFNKTTYVYNTTAVPGRITSVKMTKVSGTTRSWSIYGADESLTGDNYTTAGTQIGSAQEVSDETGTTWNVPNDKNYTYFYITKADGGTNIGEIVITYEEDKTPSITADVEEIEFEQKELSGTVTDSKTISATGKNLTAAISASMKEGSNAVFSVTPVGTPTTAAGEFTVSYSTTEAGEYAGTVVLSSGETSIEIPVSASVVAHIPVLQSIYVKGEPTKKEYYVGDAFETVGLEVWGKYDVGDDQQITEGVEWEVTPATFSATTETSVSVVAKALEKTSEAFAVTGLTVGAAPQIATYDFITNLYGHTGVSSGSDNHVGDIAVNEVFTEAPTQIKFIKSGSTVTRFWSNKGTSELRIYNGAEFTISSTDYNITKVEFSGTVNLKVGETAVSDKTWTGKQKSITFVNTSSNSALTGITVTYAVAAPSAATPTITPSTEAETYWEPITITLASTTEGASIYYTIDGTAPTTASTLYENPFEVSATTTIKAIAIKDGLDNSEVATKKFTFGPIFTSLEDLAAADLTSGTTVKVSFENVPIKSIYVTESGNRNGIYFNIQKGGKDIEIYYQNVPEEWIVGGKVSGTMICPWKYYSNGGFWELAPDANSWSWDNLTYVAPKATLSITSAKWGTFCAPFDVTLPTGVSAYVANLEGENVTFSDGTIEGVIPAKTPVVVFSESVVDETFYGVSETTDPTCQDGVLVGVYTATSGIPATTATNQNYVLQKNAAGVGFYKANNNISLKANRCYMTLPATSGAKESILFDEVVTGINTILNNKDKSVEGIFDLNGRRLSAPRKGVNIINGVKVIVK